MLFPKSIFNELLTALGESLPPIVTQIGVRKTGVDNYLLGNIHALLFLGRFFPYHLLPPRLFPAFRSLVIVRGDQRAIPLGYGNLIIEWIVLGIGI
ncbi:hypothetical protein Tco_0321056 [Tanacetum coccineum]